MAKISYVARTFVVARLLDSSTGFNYWNAQAAPDYLLQPFQLQKSVNLFEGAITAAQIIETGDCTFPLCIVSSSKAQNTAIVTPSEFAGPVITTVDFFSSWENPGPPEDTESQADWIEDAMYETFCRHDYIGASSDPNLTFNNEMDVQHGPVTAGGLNWIKQSRFQLLHRYYTVGR